MDRKITDCIDKMSKEDLKKPFMNFYANHPSGLWTDLFMSILTDLSF